MKISTKKGLTRQEIPESMMEKIKQKADSLTFEHSWEKRDSVMLDNLRFLHARRAYEKDDPRELLLTQTERASFGYGSSLTRKSIN